MNGAIDKAKELAKKYNYYMPMQFENSANPEIHYKETCKEIIKQTNVLNSLDKYFAPCYN